MKSLSYHGGGMSGSRFGSGSGFTPIYASLECNSGYSKTSQTTGSGGALTGAGGTFSVYVNQGITYSGSPVGEFTIVTPGYYSIHAGGTIRSSVTNWILRMGFQINSGTIHATKISGSTSGNYYFTSEHIIQQLAANDKVHLAYNCDFLGGSATIDLEEGFLTIVKVS